MKTIVAILAIVVIEGIALWQGVNGTTLSLSVGLIAGLGGYAAHRKRR